MEYPNKHLFTFCFAAFILSGKRNSKLQVTNLTTFKFSILILDKISLGDHRHGKSSSAVGVGKTYVTISDSLKIVLLLNKFMNSRFLSRDRYLSQNRT